MFKKVKCLLIAGLLVLGMGGNVFADETQQAVSTITNPKFVEGEFNKELQEGNIVIKATEQDGYYYYVTTEWNGEKVKIIDVKLHFEDGSVVFNEALFKEEQCGVIQDKEGWKYVNLVNDVDKKVVKIEVVFEPVKSNDPVVPPVEPPVEEPEEEVKDDPQTGDSSILLYVGTAAASIGGLYVLTRKKEDK
jgi:LPXTG-motif cell wall-anchored protein